MAPNHGGPPTAQCNSLLISRTEHGCPRHHIRLHLYTIARINIFGLWSLINWSTNPPTNRLLLSVPFGVCNVQKMLGLVLCLLGLMGFILSKRHDRLQARNFFFGFINIFLLHHRNTLVIHAITTTLRWRKDLVLLPEVVQSFSEFSVKLMQFTLRH